MQLKNKPGSCCCVGPTCLIQQYDFDAVSPDIVNFPPGTPVNNDVNLWHLSQSQVRCEKPIYRTTHLANNNYVPGGPPAKIVVTQDYFTTGCLSLLFSPTPQQLLRSQLCITGNGAFLTNERYKQESVTKTFPIEGDITTTHGGRMITSRRYPFGLQIGCVEVYVDGNFQFRLQSNLFNQTLYANGMHTTGSPPYLRGPFRDYVAYVDKFTTVRDIQVSVSEIDNYKKYRTEVLSGFPDDPTCGTVQDDWWTGIFDESDMVAVLQNTEFQQGIYPLTIEGRHISGQLYRAYGRAVDLAGGRVPIDFPPYRMTGVFFQHTSQNNIIEFIVRLSRLPLATWDDINFHFFKDISQIEGDVFPLTVRKDQWDVIIGPESFQNVLDFYFPPNFTVTLRAP